MRKPFSILCGLLIVAPTALAQNPPDAAKVATLEARATKISKQVGELAATGTLPTDERAIALLRRLVDEMAEVNAELKRLRGVAPTPAASPTPLSTLKWGGYTHFQYQDTDRKGSPQFDAFRFRRVRLSLEGAPSPRLATRISFDLAAGAAQTSTQIRDAWAAYDFSGGSKLGRDRAYAGQILVPLGYEIERPSSERELPERAQYNSTYFNTFWSRGLRVRHEGRDGMVHAALFDSLTIGDPEQINLSSGAGNKLVGIVGGRWKRPNGSLGISTLFGDRPAYTANNATSPETRRRFTYLDGEYRGFLTPRLTLRGELVSGHDRLPNATAAPDRIGRDLAAYHLAGTYRLSDHDSFSVRWEHLDPDLDHGGNALHGIGASYVRDLTSSARLTLAHEVFVDQARSNLGQTRYELTTFRLQVRF